MAEQGATGPAAAAEAAAKSATEGNNAANETAAAIPSTRSSISSSSSSHSGSSTTSGSASDPGRATGTAQRVQTAATAATVATGVTTVPDTGDRATEAGVGGDDGDDDDDDASKKKPSAVAKFMARIGLDAGTLMMMFKASLPPVIGIAMCQSEAVAKQFSTVGYLIPIISVLSMCIMPRGKYIQTLLLNLLAVSLGAALSLLILYSAVKAREHTAAPLTAAELQTLKTTGMPPYNSSQSAVCALWLFLSIWTINTLRAKLPAFGLPSITFSILLNIACTYGPLMYNMTAAKTTIKQIYTAMLAGIALATGVSLFVIPISSRRIIMAQTGGAIGLVRKAVALQKAYLHGLERDDLYALATVETAVGNLGPTDAEEKQKVKDAKRRKKAAKKAKKAARTHDQASASDDDSEDEKPLTREEKAAQALRATIGALRELSGKMQAEIAFAKRDAALGKLTAHDLGEIVKLLRSIFIPVTGLSTIMDIFHRTAERRGWANDSDEATNAAKLAERRVWNEIMQQLHEPFVILSEAIDQGLEHAGLELDLLPKSKEQKAKAKARAQARMRAKKNGRTGEETGTGTTTRPRSATGNGSEKTADVEAEAGPLQPGDEGFAAVVDAKVQQFFSSRSKILKLWARERGLLDDMAGASGSSASTSPNGGTDPVFSEREHRQSQLYVLLYMEQLMHAAGEAVQNLVEFADQRVADGTMDHKRLLFPTLRRLRKWLVAAFSDRDEGDDSGASGFERSFNVVYLGDGFGRKKDPEHLPPTNAWQRFGNGIRRVSAFLGSPESLFGLRAACATMTIAIVCFLHDTQHFFQQQRLVWAMIIIAIGMTQTSGQSIFGFFCRIFGSFLAMVFSYIIWYITDQKTVGAIVFLWFFMFWQFYFFLKFPRFIPASMIAIITQVLIIGYELQVRRLGVARAEASGQPFYPTYELAPYRLATVAGGCVVAFFWTVFPQPVTDRAWMRRDLSAILYLLANYFSVINETLRSAMDGGVAPTAAAAAAASNDADTPGTPAHQLRKVRRKLFSKLMLLLPSLQSHADFQKWEPTIGGRFPRAAYDDIILRAGRILNYLTLISYTVTWKPRRAPPKKDPDAWLHALAELVRNLGPTHYTILSTLTLLSNSLLSGQSLPPYIPLPRPYELTRQLLSIQSKPKDESAVLEEGDEGDDAASSAAAADPPPIGFRRRIFSFHHDKEGAKTRPPPHSAQVGVKRARTFSATDRGAGNNNNTESGLDWRDLAEREVSTSTGLPALMRIPTHTAADLHNVLNARNMEEHGYTEFAVLQVCSTLVCDDLEGMIQAIGGLVGVVDFSFRVDATEAGKEGKEKGKTE